ncbi:hypothetical protein [Streptomyces sp. NPDC048581]|uniref:hypothetical protein n=1 Tax=unclassified Streptomyces TaxID=2593676 RepID=UPI0037171C08
MSLTSNLKNPNSPVSRFLADRLPRTAHVIGSVRSQLPLSVATVRPQGSQRFDYRSLGRAIDRRLRVAFGSPLDCALTAGVMFAPGEVAAESGRAAGVAIREGGRQLLAELKDQPAVLAGRSRTEEERLARLCFVASHFEEVFRAGLRPGNPLLQVAPGGGLEDLLAQVPAYVPADVAQQVQLAGAEQALGWIVGLPAGQCVCAPTFCGSSDVDGADADFITAGQLIDCKATIRPERIGAAEIHQLAGYLLLDYEDQYSIKRASFYLSRQGQLVGWTVQEFLNLLGAQQPLHQLRTDCRTALASPSSSKPTRLPHQGSGAQESLFDVGM